MNNWSGYNFELELHLAALGFAQQFARQKFPIFIFLGKNKRIVRGHISFHCSSNNTISFFTMAENLPIHMYDNEEKMIDNESYELSDNEEEIEYDSTSVMSSDSDFNENDEFQAPLVVLQQPLIPSQ